MNEEIDDIIDEYEEKIRVMEETTKEKHIETVKNLETLMQEITYIEQMNDEMNTQIESVSTKNINIQKISLKFSS